MTATFVLIYSLAWGWLSFPAPSAYFVSHEACKAALNGLVAAHGERITGACYATGVRP